MSSELIIKLKRYDMLTSICERQNVQLGNLYRLIMYQSLHSLGENGLQMNLSLVSCIQLSLSLSISAEESFISSSFVKHLLVHFAVHLLFNLS